MQAERPATRPAPTVVTRSRDVASWDTRRPTAYISAVPRATAHASGTVQTTSQRASRTGTSSGMASAPISRPDHRPSPVKSRPPTPLDSRHGSTTNINWGRASPSTSRKITAATSGLPKIAEIAAADPAAARIVALLGSVDRRVRRMASRASPLPIAISGASGPTTAPPTRLATAAITTPGTSTGRVAPAPTPSTGGWPARPGRCLTARATTPPATPIVRIGHQAGGPS